VLPPLRDPEVIERRGFPAPDQRAARAFGLEGPAFGDEGERSGSRVVGVGPGGHHEFVGPSALLQLDQALVDEGRVSIRWVAIVSSTRAFSAGENL